MKAIVLAAGMGKRLMPLTKDKPKALVEVLGTSMLERTLDALARKKPNEIIVVVGHFKEAILDRFGATHCGVPIRYVVNDAYATTNNIQSLALGLEQVDEDLLLCEGDIVFEPEILDTIDERRDENIVFVGKHEAHMNGSAVVFHPKTRVIRELLHTPNQKRQHDPSSLYKTVNIYYLTGDFLRRHFVPTLELYLRRYRMTNYYEIILGVLLYMGYEKLIAEEVPNSKWFEIDDENDLEMAEYLFSADRYEIVRKLHGGYWRFPFADFCYLSNPYFPPREFFDKLAPCLPDLVGNYPSGQGKLLKLLSRWYNEDGFHPDNLVLANGASEIIRILLKDHVERVTLPVPSFNEYENPLPPERVNHFPLHASNGFALDVDALVQSVRDSGSNMLVLVNPNNPTGTMIEKRDVIHLLEALSGVTVLVDESFIDFAGDREAHSVQALVTRYPSLAVLRSISKEFGVPGIRLGYMVTANRALKQKIEERLPIWNINSVAEYFLETFVDYREQYEMSVCEVAARREELFAGLAKIDYLQPIRSYANFILCKVVGRSADAVARMLFNEYDILCKDCSNKKTLEGDAWLRFAVKGREDNAALLSALSQLHDTRSGTRAKADHFAKAS